MSVSSPPRLSLRSQTGECSDDSQPPIRSHEFLSDGGEMGALIRSLDWSETPIGAFESWSPALRMMVSFLLANRFPLLLWWGPEYVSIYNDAYRPVLGTKHPRSLGQPASECWAEIWHIIGPLIDAPFRGGPATWMEDIFLEINRHGFVEENHFTIAYSPVPDEMASGEIGGVLATVHEITEKIVGERRLAALRDLGARAGEAKTAEEACAIAGEALAAHAKDVPFALIYLIDEGGKRAQLACASGAEMGTAIAPAWIELDSLMAQAAAWPLAETSRREAMVTVEGLDQHFSNLPAGPWSDPPHTAIVVPIKSNIAHRLAGFFVAGVSPRLRLDEQYRSFLDLAAAQIATAIGNARAYEEERKRTEALAEIDRAKTLFFSNVSHEFRTPLTLMLGPLEDSLANPDLPSVERERLDVAHRNSLRLLKLVNSLLDFSRIEASRAQASYEPTDLAALTAELASNFRSACERAGLELAVDCPPLPEPVHVDRDMWEKIVLNLLSNAFKFTFAGGISVALRAVDGRAELSVRDTGVGIPRAELPRLFERFHRIEGQRSRTYEGSGIGLALVQELVKLHDGSIAADSEVDCGSTFTIRIPLGATQSRQEPVDGTRRLASSSIRAEAYVQEALLWLADETSLFAEPANEIADEIPFRRNSSLRHGAHVLVADDNADMRAHVCRLLEGNWGVQTVADGQAALDSIRERRPDLVLADVMMPRLDGFGLLRAVRADPGLSDIPVILLSARAGEESRVEGLDAGADDYLVKPFSARELVARVSSNLELSRVRREAAEALRESEARQAFLLKLSDALRPLADAVEIQGTAARLLGRHLNADRAYYAEIHGNEIVVERDYAVGLPPMAGRLPLGTWGSRILDVLGNGESIAVDDVHRHPLFAGEDVGAYDAAAICGGIGVPLVKDGIWKATFGVTSAEPRCWTESEIRLVEEVGERTWAAVERARAEAAHRQSEERYRLRTAQFATLLGHAPLGVYLVDADFRICEMNPTARANFGDIPHLIGRDFDEVIHILWTPDYADEIVRIFRHTQATGESYFTPERIENRRDRNVTEYYEWQVNRIQLPDGRFGVVCYFRDVSAQVLARQAIARSEQSLAVELAATRQLQAISGLLIREGDIQALYEKIVEAAIAVMGSDAGSLQGLDRERGELTLLAWRGFHSESAKFWNWVRESSGSICGVALKDGRRVIVPDIETCDFTTGTRHLDEYRRSGLRAVQSTPLLSRSGHLLGMISTHWREPHEPIERDLRLFDVLARQAADLIERADAEQRVQAREEQLRLAIEAADVGLWDIDLVNERMFWPARVKAMFGISPDVPVSMADFYAGLHPEDRERTSAAFADALDPEKRALYDVEYRTIGKEDGVTRWVAAKGRGLFDGNGTCIRVIGTAIDITAHKRDEERQMLLLNELDHRIKNTLATVQSFAKQTLRNASSLTDARAVFDARLIALSKAHDILTRQHWAGAGLQHVVTGALAAYADNKQESRFAFDGPDFTLQPKAALALSMALHELATNAVKYGALSNATGRISVSWRIRGNSRDFQLRWEESGGPPVAAPRCRGFGSRLIEQGLSQDLDGEVHLDFAPAGVICTIRAPLDEVAGRAMTEPQRFDASAGE